MAITSKIVKRSKLGNAFMNIVDLTITEETYVAGGLIVKPPKLGVGYTYVVMPAPAAGYIFEYDHDNHKLKAFIAMAAVTAHTHSNTLGNAAHTHNNNVYFTGVAGKTADGASEVAATSAGGDQTLLDTTAGGDTSNPSVGTISVSELAALSNGDEIEFDGNVFTKADSTSESDGKFLNQAGLIDCINDETHGADGWTAADSDGATTITAGEDGAENNGVEIFHNEPAVATIEKATFDGLKVSDQIEFEGKTYVRSASTVAEDGDFANQAGFILCVNHETNGVSGWTASASGDDVVLTSDVTGETFNGKEVKDHTTATATIVEAVFDAMVVGDQIVFDGVTFEKAASTSVEDNEFANQVGLAQCISEMSDWSAIEGGGDVTITAVTGGIGANDEEAISYNWFGRHTHTTVTQNVDILNDQQTVTISNAAAGDSSASKTVELGAGETLTASPRLIAIGT